MVSAGPLSPKHGSRTALEESFGAATASVGLVERGISLAGLPMRLRFAGEGMMSRIAGSFSHLISEERREDELTIDIWDSTSTGAPAPPLLGAPLEGQGAEPIYYYDEDGVRALSRWGTLSVLDAPAARAWFWAPGPDEMLSWDWASPLRAILHWWLGRHGILQVHGGAVGTHEGGVLVVGRGGSGKSTTTLACLSAGLRYAGDDFVGVASSPRPWVHSLYSSGKLEPHHLQRFPRLLGAVANPVRDEDEKVIVYATSIAPDLPIAGFPLVAVLVPKVVADEPQTRLVPVSSGTALAALAPSTIFQLHPPQENALGRMAALVRRVPCYSLELGSDIDRIADAVVPLIEGAAPMQAPS